MDLMTLCITRLRTLSRQKCEALLMGQMKIIRESKAINAMGEPLKNKKYEYHIFTAFIVQVVTASNSPRASTAFEATRRS
jgi:hypothetical protein